MLSTGIPKLDELLNGGLPPGSAVLLLGVPGIDATVFATQILYESIKQGNKGIYFVDNKMPRAVRESIRKMMWKTELFDEKLSFIDGFSASMGMNSEEKYTLKSPTDQNEMSKTLDKAIEDAGAKSVLVVDSLSSLVSKDEKVIESAKGWMEKSKKNELISIYIFTNWDFPEKTLRDVKEHFDYIIDLRSVEEKMLLRNYFSIAKAPTKVLKLAIPFRLGMEGVAIYVPKIIITGPYHAGKSTFIHSTSTRAVSVDRFGTTIALDHGYVDYGGIVADLFGTPGQERFSFMMDILSKDTFGIILVVDSTRPEEFERAKEMLKQVSSYSIPYVIAANKQDKKEALKPEQIRKQMGVPKDVPIIPTVAIKKKGTLDCVKALVDIIVSGKREAK